MKAKAQREICLELADHSVKHEDAVEFFGIEKGRGSQEQAARLATQFVTRNRSLLREMDVLVDQKYDGHQVFLGLSAGSKVGAVPLYSPSSARPDFGLVVQPRFEWRGIGGMLGDMGWRVAPEPLRLPLLRRSERRVPVWVLSSMILVRLQALLEAMERRFEVVEADCRAPKGSVNWGKYAQEKIVRGQLQQVPCRYPDLRDDRELRGAIRYAVERQLEALEGQRTQGHFVIRLLEMGKEMLDRLRGVSALLPTRRRMDEWLQRPMRTGQFAQGIESIEWTVEERGLAGLSDLAGVPWRMNMDAFFEAWVETVLEQAARRTGVLFRCGRRRETVCGLDWRPAYVGSQRALVPDFRLEMPGVTVIVDAKYKRHWEELQAKGWHRAAEEIREHHRQDLFQVLAYGSLAQTREVIVCLVYPCRAELWRRLVAEGRARHEAEVAVGERRVRVWLTAMPMAVEVRECVEVWDRELHSIHFGSEGGR